MSPRPSRIHPLNKYSIVTDLGFGDSGKGLTVDWLCSQAENIRNVLVVRANSGHQVGHTVVFNGKKHVFSNFGSGTFRGIPTYYSKDTVILPLTMASERNTLINDFGVTPFLWIDKNAKIATVYDVAWNRYIERINNHGSTGCGYGATVERNNDGILFPYSDWGDKRIRKLRLDSVFQYYLEKVKRMNDGRDSWGTYISELQLLDFEAFNNADISSFTASMDHTIVFAKEHVIFEGNQGVLLDKNIGFYPYVTWADCTSGPAISMIYARLASRISLENIDIFHVTRTYQTRHGNGPMTNDHQPNLINIEGESNVYNEWQGNFRRALLDFSTLKLAHKADKSVVSEIIGVPSARCTPYIVVTCVDQMADYRLIDDGNIISLGDENQFLRSIARELAPLGTFYSKGPRAIDVRRA